VADAQKIANAAALDARARPMQRVAAQIGNARVLARDPLPRAMAPLGYPEPHPLGTGLAGVKSLGAHLGDELAALAALVAAQPRELGGERLGGRHLPCLLAIVHHRQRSQSHIHPDRSDARAHRLGPRHPIGADRGEVAARPIARKCHRAQAPHQRLGAAQLHPAQPGQIHVRPSLLARTARHLLATLIEREAHACLAAAAAKPRVLRPLGEEVRKRPLLVAQHLVERLTRQLGKPGCLGGMPECGELARQRDPIQPGLLTLVGLRAARERPVPHEARRPKQPPEHALLSACRIRPQPVGTFEGGGLAHTVSINRSAIRLNGQDKTTPAAGRPASLRAASQ